MKDLYDENYKTFCEKLKKMQINEKTVHVHGLEDGTVRCQH